MNSVPTAQFHWLPAAGPRGTVLIKGKIFRRKETSVMYRSLLVAVWMIASCTLTPSPSLPPSPLPPPDDYGDRQSSAKQITIPSLIHGKFETAGDVDVFRLRVPWQDTRRELIITTTGRHMDTEGIFVCPRDWRCSRLRNDDGGEGKNFLILPPFVRGGVFYVHVKSANDARSGPSGRGRVSENQALTAARWRRKWRDVA